MMLRKPPWEAGADAPAIGHTPEPIVVRPIPTSAHQVALHVDKLPDTDAAGDPDAPLISWRWQTPSARHARAERSVTLAVDRWAASSIDCRPHDHVPVGLSYLRSFAVLETPRHLTPGLLARLYRLPGVQTVLVNNPVPRALAKARLSDLARRMGVAIHQETEADAHESLSYCDLKRHLTALVEERTAHHLYSGEQNR